MTRRDFVWTVVASGVTYATTPLVVPIHLVRDIRAKPTPERGSRFSTRIWPEAVRDFTRSGIQLHITEGAGEIRRSPGDRPIIVGLERGAINVVLTDQVPMHWDRGRALAGVTLLYEGYYLCVIAIDYAHGNLVPFVSVNTCEHELLHAILQDILVSHPKWSQAGSREFRIDWYATRLWLFRDGETVRQLGQDCVNRLRSSTS